MAGVEGLGKAGHVLGHDRAEDLVPCCQEERCSEIRELVDGWLFAKRGLHGDG